MTTFKFDNESLSVLQASLYEKDWNPVSAMHLLECIDAMGGSEQLTAIAGAFNAFISAASNGIDQMPGEGLEENVLLVKANSGLFEAVTGPRILASEDGEELILKFGDNRLVVQQDGLKLSVGRLSGELVMSEPKVGEETILVVNCDFRESGSRDIYSIPVRVLKEIEDEGTVDENGNPAKTKLTKGDLLYFLEGGTPLVEFCNLDKTGGGFVKMQELGLGKFPVVGIESKDVEWEGRKFKSYSLVLSDGRKVNARGGSERIAKNGVRIDPEKPWLLLVTKIEEKGGKFYVDNVILPPMVAQLQEQKSAKPAALPPAPDKAPARKGKTKNAAPGKTVETTATAVADFDDIPF